MTSALLISLRETFEVSLVVGLVIAILNRTQNRQYLRIVWMALASGILLSMVLAVVLAYIPNFLTERQAEFYEAGMMICAAALIVWMVVWLAKEGKAMKQKLEARVHLHLEQRDIVALFLLVFLSVLREGAELAIFLNAALAQSFTLLSAVGIALGSVLAIVGAVLLFKGLLRWLSIPAFFACTGALLLLFAVQLAIGAAHEIYELMEVPPIALNAH